MLKRTPFKDKLAGRKCWACKAKGCIGVTHLKGYCSIECQAKLGLHLSKKKKAEDDKAFKRETKQRKAELTNTISDWTKKTQAEFNKFIRLRDAKEPCISCQRHHEGQYHAGHYLTTGAHPELRFNELNCHRQCAPCNNHLSGNIVLYRKNLLNKIGVTPVEWLEGPHEPARYRIEDLKELTKHYKMLNKALENE